MKDRIDIKKVSVDLVKPNAYNPKMAVDSTPELAAEYEKIIESLNRHGIVDPIIVRSLEDKTFEIINGFHRYKAQKEAGKTEVYINDLGPITFDEALAIALSTEDTKIPIDGIELATLLKSQITEEKPIAYWAGLLPYSAEQIQTKVQLLDFEFKSIEDGGEKANKMMIVFNFDDEGTFGKVMDYFNQFPVEERAEALARLIS